MVAAAAMAPVGLWMSSFRASALRSTAVNDEELNTLAPFAAEWEAQARSAFLSAYAQATQGAGLHEALDAGQGLLGLFELEKALYELRYELNNRPDWVRIPLQGILGILQMPG